MTTLETISQLKDLIADREGFIRPGEDNDVYERDIQALRIDIAALSENVKNGEQK